MRKEITSWIRIQTAWGDAFLALRSGLITDFILPSSRRAPPFSQSLWGKKTARIKRLEKLIRKYFRGGRIDFSRIADIDFSFYTPFQNKVLQKLKKVRWGTTVSYGELAGQAGSPSACRAVGSVMAKNRTPLLLPCHRVIRANGSIGHFSGGTGLKKRLLSLEKITGKKN